MQDGTEKHKTHVESAVIKLDDEQLVNIMPWFQGNKSGETTTKETLLQVIQCVITHTYSSCASSHLTPSFVPTLRPYKGQYMSDGLRRFGR